MQNIRLFVACTIWAFVAAGAVLTFAQQVFAQSPPAAGPAPETQQILRPTATVIQIETLAMASGLGALGTGIGVGLRSAARTVTDYLTKRDAQDEKRTQADREFQEKFVGLLKEIADRYHADRTASDLTLQKLMLMMQDIVERMDNLDGGGSPAYRRREESAKPA